MAGKRIVIPNYMPALDLDGNPVSGARITFYENNTTTLKAVYTSAALNVAHPNPVIANAAGVFPSIFADEAEYFSVAISDSSGQPISGLRNFDSIRPNRVFLDGVSAPVSDAVEPLLISDTVDDLRRSIYVPPLPSDFGARGGDAATDTLGLQDFLDTGGALVMPQGDDDYLINAPLVVSSGLNLTASGSVVVRQASGVNGNLMVNAAYLAPWHNFSGQDTDVFWDPASPYDLPLTHTDHGCQVGDWYWFDGANSGCYTGVFQVVAVANYANLTLRLRRKPSANPAAISGGVLRGKKADTDIVLNLRDAVFDYNATQNTDGAQGPQTHTIVMAGVHRLRIVPPRFTDTKKFALCIVAAQDYVVEDVQGYDLQSDLLKVYGPSEGEIIGICGSPGDDFMSFQPREPDTFALYRIGSGGDVIAKVRRVKIDSAHSESPISTIYPTAMDFVTSVDFDDVRGYTATNSPAFRVLDQEGQARLQRFHISGLNAKAQKAVECHQTGSGGNAVIDDLSIEFGQDFMTLTGADLIDVPSTFTIDTLTIDGRLVNSGIGAGSLLQWGGEIRVLNVLTTYKVAAPYCINVSGTKTTNEEINFIGCDIELPGPILRASGATWTTRPRISVIGGKLKTTNTSLMEWSQSADFAFSGAVLSPGSGGVVSVYNPSASGKTIRMYVEGCVKPTADWFLAPLGNASITNLVIHPKSFDIVTNLNISWIGRETGNRLTTVAPTGAAGATDIEGDRMAVCQGTATGSWSQLGAPTRVY